MVIDYKHRLLKRIDFLKSLIVPFFQSYHTITKEQYNSNVRLRREVEKWVEDAINCVIDISKTLYSEKKMVIPETNRELLENIDLLGLFEAERQRGLAARGGRLDGGGLSTPVRGELGISRFIK